MQRSNKLGIGAVILSSLMPMACGQSGPLESDETRLKDEVATMAAPLTVAAVYNSILKIPFCTAAASGCDTVHLVAGRGDAGPERNSPNTLLRSCLDDWGGVYASDESIERVKVYSTDGDNMTLGKEVTLEVNVRAHRDYTADALDLYYYNDSAWQHITTLVPAGAGAQTLRANYILPPRQGRMQLVSAVFRRGGSAQLCAAGTTYRDRDDLAFIAQQPPMLLTTRFAAGNYFSLQLRQDGTLWSYGSNRYGQLGAGITDYARSSPVQTYRLTQVKAVAAGGSHALALTLDGTVWSWGLNNYGQLGEGSNTDQNSPIQVFGLTGVTAISAHDWHSLALKQDGTVWAWGYNLDGMLGDGTRTPSSIPVKVKGLSDVTAVAASGFHSVALKRDGTVWAWGFNGNGQLGNGLSDSSPIPVQVKGLSGVTAISAGHSFTLALRQDKTVWAWGANSMGQLGDGTTTHRSTPLQVPGLTDVTTIGGGRSNFSVVSRTDGSVWAWGDNSSGALGDGTRTNRNTPTKVPGFSDAVAVSAGGAHIIALKYDGSVWGWGGGGYGELGYGSSQGSPTPVQAPGIVSIQ